MLKEIGIRIYSTLRKWFYCSLAEVFMAEIVVFTTSLIKTKELVGNEEQQKNTCNQRTVIHLRVHFLNIQQKKKTMNQFLEQKKKKQIRIQL